ncbi:GGDEF domain-containing response regulator [Gammaproteobacteria bacterium 54_18_T64]|nr:GGDEF domain-containing response regulator [Gammaproteobacteria bacterium 54_18_T64]
MKLLLIDDDTIDRMNAKRSLQQPELNIEVTETASAEEGLELALQEDFDLILLDYQLPTMNGLEFLISLRNAASHHTPVVMLSHSNDDELALKCIEKGAQDFISKSEVTASRLMRAILHARERYKIETELRDSREQLRSLAEVDALTGLANRYMFERGLKYALPLAERQNTGLALIMLDLDRFKDVNDTLGHVIGDELLKEVARRLQAATREGDLLCRLGGDEFAILVHNLENIELAERLTQRILLTLQQALSIEGHPIALSASLGIATYPDCANNAVDLMKCADIALYRSKDGGRNRAHFYSKALHEKIQKRLELENDLRGALQRGEFVLHYQPQVAIDGTTITGAEALIRWQHPTKGLLAPAQFMPIAEELGLITDIGAWVLDSACQQFRQWREKYQANDLNLSLSINLSALQLSQPGLIATIEDTMKKHHIPHQRLELELTEHTVSKSTEQSIQLLKDLAARGINLAMDDFGTAHSSLVQLKTYPFKVLKIDKSFIHAACGNEGGTTYLRAINAFAKVLGLQVVAEGVETSAQKDFCQQLQFNRMQGYFFSKALSPEAFKNDFLLCRAKNLNPLPTKGWPHA